MELTKVKDYNTGISNNLGGDSYEIEADAEFFNHLSKRIYTDSMLAIVRELACNAWDSHVEANNTDTPVIIQCPNKLQPVFRVIDKGIGMDIESLNSVYRKYGKSTKRSDMTQTGGLGVGSKTPFSYTDSFTVYSVKDGYKHTMINYKENGIPKIKEIVTTETDEENGVTVEVPVKVNDFDAFRDRIESVANMFRGKLEVRGMKYEFESQNVYRNMTDENRLSIDEFEFPENMFRVRSAKISAFTNNNIAVLMGNVPYQLDTSKLNLTSSDHDFLKDVASYGWVTCIEVPIGCLDFSMSREHLEYSERTITYLDNYVTSLREDAQEYVDECVSTATCDVDEYQKRKHLYSKFPSLFTKEPMPPKLHVLNINMHKRGLRRLKRTYSSENPLIMVPVEHNNRYARINKYAPAEGTINLCIVHYTSKKMIRKKLAKANEDRLIQYSSSTADTSICGELTVDQVQWLVDRIHKNVGDNKEFVKINIVNLDEVEVERSAAAERGKIAARVYSNTTHNNNNYTITVGELEDSDSIVSKTSYVWLPAYGRNIEYSGNYNENTVLDGLKTLFADYMNPSSSNDDGQRYQIAALSTTHRKIALKYDNFIHIDEFIQHSTELHDSIASVFDWCIARCDYWTMKEVLTHEYGDEDIAKDMLKTANTVSSLDRWSSVKGSIADRIECLGQVMRLFGHRSFVTFPPTSKFVRQFLVEYKRTKRKTPLTPFEKLVQQRDRLEFTVSEFEVYAEKRNKKLKFKRRSNYQEITV